MPKISVIIPTYNRPGLIGKAIESVLAQSFKDFEIIVIDDGVKERAEAEVRKFNDPRISYIAHEASKGGGAARNTGILAAKGEYIAFLDDDDCWVPEKLAAQMERLENTPPEIGFSFTSVVNVLDDGEEISVVPEGIGNYHERALTRFAGFLTVTLIIKKEVFKEAGLFDEKFPSHQEPDLMIRVTKKYKGIGINKPLTVVNMKTRDHANSNINNRIKGREMILDKYMSEFKERPKILAKHHFGLGLLYRDSGRFGDAKKEFKKACMVDFEIRYLLHYISMMFNGK
jgi:glycosyltransferase involved in cell wall biosynthesis